MTKFNVGDQVRYLGGVGYDEEDLTIGGIYEIHEVESDGIPLFLDDAGDEWYVMEENEVYFELVTEPTEAPPVEASPSVIELLSNISRRLYEVEESLKPSEPSGVDTQDETADNVNSPQHYRHGRFETIELIEDITKKYDDGFVAYCVGNAVKYVDRAPFKHGSPSEDLRKAAWYLTRAAEHTNATTPPST